MTTPGRQTPDAPLHLFCFHHAGGGASVFRHWPGLFDDTVAIRPVQLPGREGRFKEPRFTRIEPLVVDLDNRLDPELEVPHAFFGHSMGALVAYRLTIRRLHRGATLPEALLAASYPAPHLTSPIPDVARLPRSELLQELSRIGGLPEPLLSNSEMLDMLLTILRDDLSVCASHSVSESEPLPVPLHVFGGRGDPLVAERALCGWEQHTSSSFELHIVRGGHFLATEDSASLIDGIRYVLRKYTE